MFNNNRPSRRDLQNTLAERESELRAMRAAGLEFVGRMREIQNARDFLLQEINDQACYGMAIYFIDPQYPDELGILDQVSINSSEDHKEFVSQFLMRKRLVAKNTSVYDALESGQSGVYPSKMLAHDCYNHVTQTAHGPLIFQFPFRADTHIDQDRMAQLLDEKLDGQAGLRVHTHDLMGCYGASLTEHLRLQPPTGYRNGVLLSVDISASSAIIGRAGETSWNNHLRNFNEMLQNVAEDYGVSFDRDTGDGGLLGFSAEDQLALRAVPEILRRYEALKQQDHVTDSARPEHGPFIRSVLSSGYFHASVSGQMFPRPKIRVNGLPYIWAEAAQRAAPRDRNVALMTPDSLAHFEVRQDFKTKSLHTKSTAMPVVHEWNPSLV